MITGVISLGPDCTINAVEDGSDTVTEPLMVWLPLNVFEPVVANEPVSIGVGKEPVNANESIQSKSN